MNRKQARVNKQELIKPVCLGAELKRVVWQVLQETDQHREGSGRGVPELSHPSSRGVCAKNAFLS